MRLMSYRIICWFVLASLLASCGNIGITKRRHLPGFHVDLGTKEKSNKATYSRNRNEPVRTSELRTPNLFASAAKDAESLKVRRVESAFQKAIRAERKESNRNSYERVDDVSLNKTAREARKLLKAGKEDKYGKWRAIGWLAICAGITAIFLVVTGLGFLIAWYYSEFKSEHDKPVLGLLLTGGILGLIGLFAGGLSKKRTDGRERRFAITGLITGIVALGIMILSFLVMAIGGLPNG